MVVILVVVGEKLLWCVGRRSVLGSEGREERKWWRW